MKIANQMSQLKTQVGTIPESNSPSIRNTQFTENLGQINQGIGAL